MPWQNLGWWLLQDFSGGLIAQSFLNLTHIFPGGLLTQFFLGCINTLMVPLPLHWVSYKLVATDHFWKTTHITWSKSYQWLGIVNKFWARWPGQLLFFVVYSCYTLLISMKVILMGCSCGGFATQIVRTLFQLYFSHFCWYKFYIVCTDCAWIWVCQVWDYAWGCEHSQVKDSCCSPR